jgi:hypothetical protein
VRSFTNSTRRSSQIFRRFGTFIKLMNNWSHGKFLLKLMCFYGGRRIMHRGDFVCLRELFYLFQLIRLFVRKFGAQWAAHSRSSELRSVLQKKKKILLGLVTWRIGTLIPIDPSAAHCLGPNQGCSNSSTSWRQSVGHLSRRPRR